MLLRSGALPHLMRWGAAFLASCSEKSIYRLWLFCCLRAGSLKACIMRRALPNAIAFATETRISGFRWIIIRQEPF